MMMMIMTEKHVIKRKSIMNMLEIAEDQMKKLVF